MQILLFSLFVASVVAAAFFMLRRYRNRRALNPASRMRLSDREVADLARQSVQRFLQDRHDAAA
jgi:hypothetical protein